MPQSSNLNTISTNSLPVWAWVLIAIGVILFLILIIALIWYAFKGAKQSTKATRLVQTPVVDPLMNID